MADTQVNIDIQSLINAISAWLEKRLNKESYHWITKKNKTLAEKVEDWEFFSSFSAVPRHTGKESLSMTDAEKEEANSLRSNWKPEFWSIDQLGRAFLLLSISQLEQDEFLDKLEKVFISSDNTEAVALYRSLAILPYPKSLQARAAEGIRSNMTSIFNAVALRNPYPGDFLEESAWNQLVLKALFIGSPLYLIQGIDRRANKALAHMLVDYAHERWAADRDVSPELWRTVGPFITDDILPDLVRVLESEKEIEQQAAMLALLESSHEEAARIAQKNESLKQDVENGNVSWNEIGRRFHNR